MDARVLELIKSASVVLSMSLHLASVVVASQNVVTYYATYTFMVPFDEEVDDVEHIRI